MFVGKTGRCYRFSKEKSIIEMGLAVKEIRSNLDNLVSPCRKLYSYPKSRSSGLRMGCRPVARAAGGRIQAVADEAFSHRRPNLVRGAVRWRPVNGLDESGVCLPRKTTCGGPWPTAKTGGPRTVASIAIDSNRLASCHARPGRDVKTARFMLKISVKASAPDVLPPVPFPHFPPETIRMLACNCQHLEVRYGSVRPRETNRQISLRQR